MRLQWSTGSLKSWEMDLAAAKEVSGRLIMMIAFAQESGRFFSFSGCSVQQQLVSGCLKQSYFDTTTSGVVRLLFLLCQKSLTTRLNCFTSKSDYTLLIPVMNDISPSFIADAHEVKLRPY